MRIHLRSTPTAFLIRALLAVCFSGFVFAQDWREIAETVPYQPHANIMQYGWSVSIDGDFAVVGSHGTDDYAGAAYVLHRVGDDWETLAKLTASDGAPDQYFGHCVSISGGVVVAGAYHDDDNGEWSGSAYVFVRPESGWADMTQTGKLLPSDGARYDEFGLSLSISGDHILVGSAGDDPAGPLSGTAYIFSKPDSGWRDMRETARLVASDGAAQDYFGRDVFLSGGVAAVSSAFDDDRGNLSGSVYLFVMPPSGWVDTIETVKITASDGSEGEFFGSAVGVSGDYLVVGTYRDAIRGDTCGSVYVFRKPASGWTEIREIAKLTPSDGEDGDKFGLSVAVAGNIVVAGARDDDDAGGRSGSAYVFVMPDSGWRDATETQKLTASDADANALFGNGVAVSGTVILAGAPASLTEAYASTGSAYFFTRDGSVAAFPRRAPAAAVSPSKPAAFRPDGSRFKFGSSRVPYFPYSAIPGR